jgi:hypothetical protein
MPAMRRDRFPIAKLRWIGFGQSSERISDEIAQLELGRDAGRRSGRGCGWPSLIYKVTAIALENRLVLMRHPSRCGGSDNSVETNCVVSKEAGRSPCSQSITSQVHAAKVGVEVGGCKAGNGCS